MTKKNLVDESADRVNRNIRHRISQEIVSGGTRGPTPVSGGRPLSDDPKDASYTLRLTSGELDNLRSAANSEHKAVAEYIRDKLGF